LVTTGRLTVAVGWIEECCHAFDYASRYRTLPQIGNGATHVIRNALKPHPPAITDGVTGFTGDVIGESNASRVDHGY
jgi:hypothetical protein